MFTTLPTSAIPHSQTKPQHDPQPPILSNIRQEYHNLQQVFSKDPGRSFPPHCPS